MVTYQEASMSTQTVGRIHVSEIEPHDSCEGEEPQWLPVRHHFGVRAFGVNAWRAPHAGAPVIEDHTETEGGADGHEELYFVASGHARFTVESEEIDAPEGTFVYVGDPSLRRSGVGLTDGTLVLAMGAKAGKAFRVSSWESKHFDG
jgi:mannose-6-phosphate isomerase-like protein (cupin superfamily)